MSNITIFTPKDKLDAKKNLKHFIEFAESLTPLNNDLDYESEYWDGCVNFTRFGVSSKNRDPKNLLDHSIIRFAKAYFTYMQTHNRTGTQNEIKALRAVNNAMLKSHGKVIITEVDSIVLDNAVQVIREKLGKAAAYHGGVHLQRLQEFLVKKNIIQKFTWINPIKRGKDTVSKIGEEGRKYREKKLPDDNALYALAEISNLGEDNLSQRDIFTTSIMTLLLCAPARGSEPLYLKKDCLVYDVDTNGNNAVGLRWYSGKGYGYETEWVPDVMVEDVKEAVRRLLNMSKSARDRALNMELAIKELASGKTPIFPRHKHCPKNISDTKLLTYIQVANALGYGEDVDSKKYRSNAASYVKRRGLKTEDYKYCLVDLLPVLITRLPKGFPYVSYKKGNDVKVKWSEALFGFHENQFNLQKGAGLHNLWMPDINTLNESLAKTKKMKKGKSTEPVNVESIFQRNGYPSEYKITTHQLRHLLDTIANVNGMKEMVLTKWAGRKDSKHNRVYNHTTPEQYNDQYTEIRNKSGTQIKKVSFSFEVVNPSTIQEINTRKTQTAHTSEFGACLHDFITSPCSKHRDCINCDEQVCVKGDDDKLKRLKKRLALEIHLLGGDKKAVGEELIGADRHYQKRLITIQRCEELISLLENDKNPEGTIIKLSIDSPSNLDLALEKNYKKQVPKIERVNKSKPRISNRLIEMGFYSKAEKS